MRGAENGVSLLLSPLVRMRPSLFRASVPTCIKLESRDGDRRREREREKRDRAKRLVLVCARGSSLRKHRVHTHAWLGLDTVRVGHCMAIAESAIYLSRRFRMSVHRVSRYFFFAQYRISDR
ncbi:hypothetical protein PUN28_013589 [Cardiocondyla obscurior]|uniref:Uncharacterized protein n=1 Tax=Cardiocondyla obscurior TaxID=286306 RepID=A0AAW2F6C6_9HYME